MGIRIAGISKKASDASYQAVIGAASGTDDTATIQALLTAARTAGGGHVKGLPGQAYKVSAPLVIGSGTTLDMTGCTVTLNAASNSNILQNYAVTSGVRDTNITVRGGGWARGANTGTGTANHSLMFRKVDGLTVSDGYHTSSAGKYAINVGDCTDFRIEGHRFATASDGVHVNGPASNGVIRDLFGTTGDDFVSLTPADYAAYNDTSGDITDITIEGLYPTATAATALKVLGGNTGASKRIRARNIGGSSLATTGAVYVGDDTTSANTQGVVDQILVENVSTTVPNGTNVVYLYGSSMRTLVVRGLFYDSTTATTSPISVNANSASTVASLTVERVRCANLAALAVLTVAANAAITNLSVRDVRVATFTSGAATVPVISLNANIGTARISDVSVDTCTGGELVRVASTCTVTRLMVNRASIISTANAVSIVSVYGTVTDLDMNAANGQVAAGGYALTLVSSAGTAAVTKATMRGVHWVGSSGGLVVAATSTHTLPNVEILGCVADSTAWVADLATTTEIHMVGLLTKTLTNGSFNVRATASVTLRGEASSGLSATVAGGGNLFSRSFGVNIDVSKLTKTAGHLAYNTNAGLSCGSGPVVGNATPLWQHILTAATY